MSAGLSDTKPSRIKRIKVSYFPGAKIEDLQYHLIPYLKKKPDNIIIHIGTNDSPYKTEDLTCKELVNVKETINKLHVNPKNIVISSPIFQTHKKEANNLLKKYNNISKQEERDIIFHNNISASRLHRDGLHLNLNDTAMLAGKLLSRIRTFWYNADSDKETNLSNDLNGNNIISPSNYKSLINYNSAFQLGSVKSVLKSIRSNQPQQVIIVHLNINYIRKKFDIMKPILMHDVDSFMAKSDDSFPVSKFNIEGFSSPFRLNRNKNGGGIILNIRTYVIASKLTSFTFPNDIEAFFIEINLKGNKYLVCCPYSPNRIFLSNHLDYVAKRINNIWKSAKNFINGWF